MKYTLAILSTLALGTTSSCFAAAHSAPYHHQEGADISSTWHHFAEQFKQAFHRGDVTELERLKTERGKAGDFHNINDLGSEFMKYGPGMDKWAQLIADAQKNNPSSVHTASAPAASWQDFTNEFKSAFHHGDTSTLERLKTEWQSKGFYNINDLGGEFLKYGTVENDWQKLIIDAHKNRK